METERSFERILQEDLYGFAEIAKSDRDDFFKRYHIRMNTFRCGALCQGGALHYLNQTNGLKDIDVWSFFEKKDGIKDFPVRRRVAADLGESKFGVNPDDKKAGFKGRRIDLLGRSIEIRPEDDIVSALRRYLSEKQTGTARALAEKAVVLIEPEEYLGFVVWPID